MNGIVKQLVNYRKLGVNSMTYMYKSRRVNELNVLINVVEHPTETIYHEHDFLELVYVLEGKAEHTVNDVKMTIARGDYFIIDYGTKHKYKRISQGTFKIMNCMFSPMVIDPSLKNCRRFKELINHYLINFDSNLLNSNPTNYVYHDKNGDIYKLLTRMNKEYTAKKIGYQEVMRGQFIELLINIIRNITIEDTDVYDNNIVQYILKHVQKHYAEKISLQEIATKYNYSLNNASRIFKEKTGVSFQDYVQSVRIKESCRLLLHTSDTIPIIAQSVGYGDIKFFNQLFKRHLGISPSEYRKSQRNHPH